MNPLQKNNSQIIRSSSSQMPFYVEPKQVPISRPIVYQEIIRNPNPLPSANPTPFGIGQINVRK